MERSKLAETLEISEFSVNKIENGSERMTAGELMLALQLFKISGNDFVQRVENNVPKAEEMML